MFAITSYQQQTRSPHVNTNRHKSFLRLLLKLEWYQVLLLTHFFCQWLRRHERTTAALLQSVKYLSLCICLRRLWRFLSKPLHPRARDSCITCLLYGRRVPKRLVICQLPFSVRKLVLLVLRLPAQKPVADDLFKRFEVFADPSFFKFTQTCDLHACSKKNRCFMSVW